MIEEKHIINPFENSYSQQHENASKDNEIKNEISEKEGVV